MTQPRITISRASGESWQVEVRSEKTTTHTVTIPAGFRERLDLGGIAPERLLEESFRFLLEREPNTSILSTFGLPLIGSYFPDYETEIVRRLR
ncbi:MAG: hypothetical protein ACREIA_12115 [Opitutaceae bacterium]